jgi:hypothetical protein
MFELKAVISACISTIGFSGCDSARFRDNSRNALRRHPCFSETTFDEIGYGA